MSRRATVLAPAKVNLALRVLGRRDDGYHDIDTLFQAVDLYDEVVVGLGGEGVRLEIDGPELGPVEENLAYRAAARFVAGAGVDAGVHVRLTKRIPVGAGLGGGSSDAAAVLRALAALRGGVDRDRLRAIAAELGSDVPFFLCESPLARGTGRGEVLRPLPALPTAHLVLVSPPVHVSTAEAYRALAEARAAAAPASAPASAGNPDAAGEPPPAGDSGSVVGEAPRLGAWSDLERTAVNDFEPLASVAHPEIERALESLRAAGATVVLMTGSGSTCFGLLPGRAAAERAAADLHERTGWPCTAVRTLESFPAVRTERP